MPHQLIVPRRDERMLEGDLVSLRYIKFFEEISVVSNQQSSQLGETVIITGGTYTTLGAISIICTAAATIILNANPENRERVTVNRTNGEVSVSANGVLINTEANIILSKNETSLDFFFSLEQNQWYIF